MNRDRPWETQEVEWRAEVNRVRAGQAAKTQSDGQTVHAVRLRCPSTVITKLLKWGRDEPRSGEWPGANLAAEPACQRILDTLARHDVNASFFVPAVAGLIEPNALKPITDVGSRNRCPRMDPRKHLSALPATWKQT